MSNELAITTSRATLPEQMEFAQALAEANLLPRAYQRQPANILLAVQMGDALGIPPIQAINSIHIIEGKPSASADLIASLVRRAGHTLRIITGTDEDGPTVTAQLIRRDDPEFVFEALWNTAKAKQANLLGKGNWKTYPDQMMRNRAITEVCRQGAGDALFGVIYDPEELGGVPAPTVTQVPTTSGKRAGGVAAAKAAAKAAKTPAADTNPDGITEAQQAKLWATLRDLGLDQDRDEALTQISEHAGRTIGSTIELTKAEASQVIDGLAALAAADPDTGEVLDADLVDDAAEGDGDDWPEVKRAGDQA